MGTAGVIIGISLDGGATNAYTVNMNTATTVTPLAARLLRTQDCRWR